MKMKSLFFAAGIALAGAGSAYADSSDPIKIPINEWTGQHISAHILGSLFEKAGYSVEYVTAGAVPQYAAISQGDLQDTIIATRANCARSGCEVRSVLTNQKHVHTIMREPRAIFRALEDPVA